MQNGITLIALIITIIVLLILAGVSLSLIVGQNGVLNKATESVSATKKGTAVEQVSLAWSACQTDYLANNDGSEKSTFFTKEKMNENLSQGEVISVEFEKDANGSEVKYKLDNTTYTVIVSNDGIVKIVDDGTNITPATYTVTMTGTGVTFSNAATTVEEGSAYNNSITANGNYKLKTITATMGETAVETVIESETSGKVSIASVTGNIVITVVVEEKQLVSINDITSNPSEYYGKKVTGYTANEISDWRIFYADDENVFLITTDYITSDKIVAANNTMTANGTYCAYWNKWPSSESITINTTNIAKFSPVTNETMAWERDMKSNENTRCSSTLLDTSKWTSFLDKTDGTGKAEMAVGSPTLNMWVASWNAKYPEDKIYSNSENGMGYKVGTSSNPTTYYIDSSVMSAKTGYKVDVAENMYYPNKFLRGPEDPFGYWLASPSAGGTWELFIVGISRRIE